MIYTPLYIKTEYSLLNSMIKIKDLIEFAKENHLKALTITDNNLCGAMEFYTECVKNNIKPIIGLNLNIDESEIVLYAKNYIGYKNLIKISTLITENELNVDNLKKYSSDLICIKKIEEDDLNFFENIYYSYETKDEYDSIKNSNKIYMKQILYLNKDDSKYYKYLDGIKNNLILEQLRKFDNYNLILPDDLEFDLSKNYEIYDLCNLKIEFSKSLLPKFNCPDNLTSYEYLKKLCIRGLKNRFGETVSKKYIDRLKYELNIINEMNFCDYFLIVWDYVKYAKENNILVGPGRGSSAGSLVSYCLNIIEIDPIKYNLLFERFLNKERITMPDIDIDFDGERKEEVIEYCKKKYGYKNVTNIITFSSLTSKQVLKDVGKVLDLKQESVDYFVKMFKPKMTLKQNYNEIERIRNHIEKNPELRELFEIALKLENLKKHISLHASGIVISNNPMDEVIPLVLYNNNYLTGYTMEYLENIGLIKMDFLSLKTLSTIRDILGDINDDLDIKLDDFETFEIFKKGDMSGIFQFESDMMIDFLKRFKPRNFEEVYNATAICRPGPMKNIKKFIDRRNNIEKLEYYDKSLENILKPTYGIIIYQEQIMQIANIMANYSLAEADLLRRAMSKKKEEILISEKEKFINRSIDNGYSKDVATNVYEAILKFAEYGFPKAHAVAYSLISYKMAYLKAHYRAYFMKKLLNDSICNKDELSEYIKECKDNNIKVINPDINKSESHFKVNDNELIYPFLGINGLNINAINHIIKERNKKEFLDIFDFVKRIDKNIVTRQMIENLIKSGCFDSFSFNRRTLLENLDIILNYAKLLDELSDESVLVPELDVLDEFLVKDFIKNEYDSLGLYLNMHPVSEYRKKYDRLISLRNIDRHISKNIDIIVKVDSVKEVRTKKQELICFLIVSDENYKLDAPIFSEAYKLNPKVSVGDIININGRVNRRDGKIQLIVNNIDIIESN